MIIGREKKKQEPRCIEIGPTKEKVVEKKSNEPTRFLGVWLSRKSSQHHALNIARKEVNTIIKALARKSSTLAQLIYINNRVLLPRLEYRLQHSVLLREQCDRLQSPLVQLIKNKSDLAITSANTILAHKNIAELKTI